MIQRPCRGIWLPFFLSIIVSVAVALPELAKAQLQATDISILGIKPGMTAPEVSSRLSGYQIKTYPGALGLIVASKGRVDTVTIETINGRVAYIGRDLYLRIPGETVSLNNYRAEMEKKFGAEASASGMRIAQHCYGNTIQRATT